MLTEEAKKRNDSECLIVGVCARMIWNQYKTTGKPGSENRATGRHQAGNCCVRQWMEPSPQMSSWQSMEMTL